MIQIHAAVLLFGTAGLFGKLLPLPPVAIVLGRTAFASATLAVILLWRRTPLRAHCRRDLVVLILLGGLLAVHWITFFRAIQVSTVAVGLLTFSTFPVFVTFMEPYFFNETLRPFDISTALSVLLGLAFVLPGLQFDHHITRGACWGILSGLTFAMLSLVYRKYVRTYSPLVIAFYQNTIATLLLLPGVCLLGGFPEPRDILLLAVLGVFCTALAHVLFIRSLAGIRTQLASIIACLEPVYGIGFAFFLLDEVPAPRTLLGGAIIIGTIIAASYRRQGYGKQQTD